MGSQIIKQPDGKYAIFCTNVDKFALLDATPKAVVDYFVKIEVARATKSVTEVIDGLKKGEKPISSSR